MTTVKGGAKVYFNCTGRSHKHICQGQQTPIIVNELEEVISQCISVKLEEIATQTSPYTMKTTEIMTKIRAVELAEKQLVDSMLSTNANNDLIKLLNERASSLKIEKQALQRELDDLQLSVANVDSLTRIIKLWDDADFVTKKEIVLTLIDRIVISANGDAEIVWNI